MIATMDAPAIDHAAVSDALAVVRDRIASTGAAPGSVRIVAVTKGFGRAAVDAAVAVGLTDVGENYAQDLRATWREGPTWHFLGAPQRNKLAALVPLVDLWQAIGDVETGRAVATRAPGAAVLVQVNVARDPARPGCAPDETGTVVDGLRRAGLDVLGLMAVAPIGDEATASRAFAEVRSWCDRLGLGECSMGMSGDLEAAVREGSTMVRVGSALFGPRPSRPLRGLRAPTATDDPRRGGDDLRR